MNQDERIERLEMEVAHQQRTLDQLNEVVIEQSIDLLRLQRTIQQIAKQIEQLATPARTAEPVDLADEKPPHY